MTKYGLGTYSLMVTVVLWGVLLGGVVYAHIVYFPVYLSHLPESSVVVNGPYGLNEAVFWMTIHPLLVLSLVVSLALNWRDLRRRKLIAMSLVVYVIILVISSLYFIPQLVEFRNSPQSNISAEEWLARGNRWQYLSWIRGSVLFIFSVPLLFSLAAPKSSDENR